MELKQSVYKWYFKKSSYFVINRTDGLSISHFTSELIASEFNKKKIKIFGLDMIEASFSEYLSWGKKRKRTDRDLYFATEGKQQKENSMFAKLPLSYDDLEPVGYYDSGIDDYDYDEDCDCYRCNNERKTNMRTETQIQREYLNDRACSIYGQKDHELSKNFGLIDDDMPITWEDLIARITAGKYVLTDETKKKSWQYDRYGIRWRDPSKKEDKDGYKKAHDALSKEHTALTDSIAILDPKEGLEALKAFEAKTFH